MKKLFVISAALACLGLTACGSNQPAATSSEGDESKVDTSEVVTSKEEGTSEEAEASKEAETSEEEATSEHQSEGSWSEEIAGYMIELFGETIPHINNIFDEETLTYEAWPEDDEYYAGMYIWDVSEEDRISESYYDEILESAGYEYMELDDYLAYGYVKILDNGNYLFVDYYYYDPGDLDSDYPAGNYIDITLFDDVEEEPTSGELPEIDPTEFLEGDTISFANEDYLVTPKNEESTAWAVGTNVFYAIRNGAATGVGNGSYFSNPLRMYTGQIGFFSFLGDVPSKVVVTVNTTATKSSPQNIAESVTGASVSVEENIVTFVPDADVQGFEFEVTNKQAHIDSIQFVA